jgi:hypothetical protein
MGCRDRITGDTPASVIPFRRMSVPHTVVRKTQRPSCSAGQEAVLVVKSVQEGVRHNSARSVESVPLTLQMHAEI